MTRYLIIIFILFLFSLSSAMADAQQDKAKIETSSINSAKKTDTTQVIKQGISKKGISESEAYQLLYANSKEANASILTTLHFSLAIVAAFLLALVGSQIFFNYRLSKEEISNLRNSILNEIDNKIGLLSDKVLANNKDQSQIVENAMNSKLEERSKLLDAKIEVHKKDIEALRASFDRDLKDMSINLEEATGHIWNLRGVQANALTSFIRTAELEIEARKFGIIQYMLDNIIETLSGLKEIHIADYSSLEKLVKMIPKENAEQKKKIVELFQSKPVYDYLDKPDGKFERVFVKNVPTAR